MMNTITILLLCHAVLAVALVGALTHQSISVFWHAKAGAGAGFVSSVRAVTAAKYANAVIVLYLLTAFIGGVLLYPTYRVFVRTFLEQLHRYPTVGTFEMKENFVAIGLGMLPVYWYYWRQPLAPEHARVRALITLFLTFIVWWAFFVGHIINNIRGFGI
jgi:hypothetical protein